MKHFILFAWSFFSIAPMALNAQDCNLSGVVIDEETNEPIVGATVYLKTHSQGDRSDANGNFFFKNVEGPYALKVALCGYPTTTVKGGCLEVNPKQGLGVFGTRIDA
jgi:iron complex outermembrane recepter protein